MVFPSTDLDIIVEVYLGADPTADPGTWPAPTDLSSRLLRKPIQIRRGRGQNQKTAQAGACALWLDNSDGALTPLLATSTYFPDWDLGVPLRVSVDNVGAAPPYVRHAGFVASIEAVMVPGAGGTNISAVRVTSAGVLRRLSQGAVAKSPMRRAILGSEPVAYWTLEDEPGATVGGSALGGPPLTVVAGTVNWAGAVPPGGVEAAPDLSDGGRLDAPTPSITQAWTVEWVASTTASITGVMIQLAASGATYADWYVFVQDTEVFGGASVYAGNGVADQLNLSGAVFATFDETWRHYRLTASQSGANIAVTFATDGIETSGTLTSATLGTLAAIRVNSLFVETIAGSVAHVAIYDGVMSDDHSDALDGFDGELAHVRFERVCNEEGIAYSGTATQSNEMGPQPVADVVGLLVDCEQVDHGMLIEDFAWGLSYRSYDQRVNIDPALTIDLSTYRTTAGTQADVLTPVRNDARIRNEWTVTRPGGSSATAKDEAHQAKRGRYKDSATVNVDGDGRILDEAQWRVHEGTFEGLRYDTIPLDIGANE